MTLQNNDRERAFGPIYGGLGIFSSFAIAACECSPIGDCEINAKKKEGLSNIIVPGTSLFLRGMRFLADCGHGASCIAFRCGRARKFAPRKGREVGRGHTRTCKQAALSREIAEQLAGFGFYGCR
jgi:hypothetical protein